MRKPVRPGPTLFALMLLGVAWARPASAQSEAPIAPLAPEPPPAASADSPATAGRDRHAAGSPGHPVRWADSRRAALERAARDRAGRPRGRRGRPARRAPPRAHRRDDRPHRAAQAVRKAGPGDA